MKSIIKKIAFLLSLILIVNVISYAQANYHAKTADVKLSGTSNIHDWDMVATAASSDAAIVVNGSGQVTAITSLNFVLPAVNLKSKHTQMDKNTYKALNTSKYPNISFSFTSGTVTPTGNNTYQINAVGRMSIAGTVKQTDLQATGKYNPADKSFTVTGVKKMKMTDYKVDPPKALMGTIKTGDAISIAYTVKFTK
ncbi:MAG: YceI family protein [Chitinophagaceae bacterium]|nr:MAG: YceI family protein [Chitinophagaceae bacterium]